MKHRKHRLLIRITQSAAFYYRDQLIKSPIPFPLRRIFTGLVGAVALAGLAAAAPASAAEPTIPFIVSIRLTNCTAEGISG